MGGGNMLLKSIAAARSWTENSHYAHAVWQAPANHLPHIAPLLPITSGTGFSNPTSQMRRHWYNAFHKWFKINGDCDAQPKDLCAFSLYKSTHEDSPTVPSKHRALRVSFHHRAQNVLRSKVLNA